MVDTTSQCTILESECDGAVISFVSTPSDMITTIGATVDVTQTLEAQAKDSITEAELNCGAFTFSTD